MNEREFTFDVECVENRALARVVHELGRAAGRDDLHEPRRTLHGDFMIDDHFADLVGQHVAQ